MISASSPGKTIIFGDHAVVYGQPGIVAAVNRRLRVDMPDDFPVTLAQKLIDEANNLGVSGVLQQAPKLKVSSEIPIGSRLGSSAALAVAISAVLLARVKNNEAEKSEINNLSYQMETVMHGTPSGADNTTLTYGGLIRFQRDELGKPTFTRLSPTTLPQLFLINTGKPAETTAEMVAGVRLMREKNTQYIDSLFSEIGEITRIFMEHLKLGVTPEKLIELIRKNQRLLEQLEVSSERAGSLIREIEEIGGAAKVSGGGGRKTTSGLILAVHADPEHFSGWLQKKQLPFQKVEIDQEGVRYE